jgi:integrase
MTGSIKQRPNGMWRARYRDDNGKEHAAHRATKRDAQRWLDEQTAKIVSNTHVDPSAGKITFSSFYAEWAERQIWKTSTRKAMDLAARSFTFRDLALNRIRRSHIEQYVKAMQVAGLAATTIRTRFVSVGAVFNAAVVDKVIGSNPMQDVKRPKVPRQEDGMVIPAAEDVAKLLAHASDDFAVLVALCAFAGLRIGEAPAVQVGDINFPQRTLKVSRQVQRGIGGVEIRLPKYDRTRTVYLPDDLLIMLSGLIQRDGCSTWLFDGPPAPRTVYGWWQQLCRRAGVDGYTPHDLRHYFASGLIASGCDVVTVQRALGHTSATTTLDIYAHLWPNAEDRTRSAAADLMRTVRGLDDQLGGADKGK